MNFSRMRLLALLLVAVFSFAAVGAATIASATDATTSAKKKSKKCKKGYKKVGKKCKKKKATTKPKTSAVVASVTITKIDPSAYGTEITGTVTLKTPVTSLKVIAFFSQSGKDIPRERAVPSDGVSTTVPFTVRAAPPRPGVRDKSPVTYFVTADGVKSNVLP